MDGLEEPVHFIPEEVTHVVTDCVEQNLANVAYHHGKVSQWTSNVLEATLKKLSGLGKPYKYVVSCTIMQKTGAGLHTATSCYWDSETDGSATIRWENKKMYCIVTVFGLAI
eukprot:Clim_evm17s247 gene=Clim_evmTU17s247